MMLGLLLARAGVEVLVLEKHGDFLRDFRGDTVHPSTLEVMYELGFLDEFLELPHQKMYEIQLPTDSGVLRVANFRKLRTRCPFIAFMPQWDFLDFLARKARSYPGFELRMRTEATGLLEDAGGLVGIRATGPEGDLEVRAGLVVACDGRSSIVAERAGFAARELGAPIDVLWFRVSRRPEDPEQLIGRLTRGRGVVLLNRGTHWQCGYLIPKGTADDIKARGLDRFLISVSQFLPFLAGRMSEIRSWDDVPLLSVRVNRLRRWYRPGLLCIGDAAHAMSPIGGVGINLAIQDAVAAANLLTGPLREDRVTPADLRRVQRRRVFPTRVIQRVQLLVQNRLLAPALRAGADRGRGLPLGFWVAARIPILQWVVGWLIGRGVRSEHVRTPELAGSFVAQPPR